MPLYAAQLLISRPRPAVRQIEDALAARSVCYIDELVNNAGIGLSGPFAEADPGSASRSCRAEHFSPDPPDERSPAGNAGSRPKVAALSTSPHLALSHLGPYQADLLCKQGLCGFADPGDWRRKTEAAAFGSLSSRPAP